MACCAAGCRARQTLQLPHAKATSAEQLMPPANLCRLARGVQAPAVCPAAAGHSGESVVRAAGVCGCS